MMVETETRAGEATEPVELNKAHLLTILLTLGGILVGLVTVCWALARYGELAKASDATASDFLRTTALMFIGLGLGCALGVAGEVLRRLDAVLEALRALPAAGPATLSLAARHDQAAPTTDNSGALLRELVVLTRELRDVSLLDDEERQARVRAQGQALARQLTEEIPAMLREHDWLEARQRVQAARERFPTFSEWDHLEEQIEKMRSTVETRDIETATRQVDDLAALGAWERAASVVSELRERHPDSAPARELARRVRIQRDKASAEHRARLMAQAQEAVGRREWNQALALANDVIRRFPRSPEAEALRQQLPTLAENAEIQTRQHMEQEFRGLMQRHRYRDALRLARDLIARYPASPQAEVLRAQLARLEAKAAGR
ncbi:MAG: hypothetical protein PVJ57_05715 [Phycisphaerae bacterium]